MWAAPGTLVLGVGCLGRPRGGLPHVADLESSCLEVEESMGAAYYRDIVSKSFIGGTCEERCLQKTNKNPSNGFK